jgi:hypothetical protein
MILYDVHYLYFSMKTAVIIRLHLIYEISVNNEGFQSKEK